MNKDELMTKLKAILAAYVPDQETLSGLTEETDFIKDLQINSANLVDVVLDIEEEFGIEIDNESMQNMLTVKSALAIITQKLDPS